MSSASKKKQGRVERSAVMTTARRAKVGPVTILDDPSHEEELEVFVFPQGVEPAFVEIDMKATKNVIIGRASNYISMSAKVALPVLAEEVDDVVEPLGEYLRGKLDNELDALERLVRGEAAAHANSDPRPGPGWQRRQRSGGR